MKFHALRILHRIAIVMRWTFLEIATRHRLIAEARR